MSIKGQSGFTIVELLITIVVIAILAAISIVAYNGIQERARLSSAQANLRQNFQLIQLFHAENGRYPMSAVELTGLDLQIDADIFRLGTNQFVYCYTSGGAEAALSGQIEGFSGVDAWWSYNSVSGIYDMPSSGGGNINARCNAAMGDASSSVVNGQPSGNWAAWTGN